MKIVFALLAAAASALVGIGSARADEQGAARAVSAPAATAPAALVLTARAITADERPREYPDEYGTPATIIRAFYRALAEGQGELAAMVIIPEKTKEGPFSAAELSRFFGALREPISLIDLFRAKDGDYIVHYRYAASTRQCDGRAVVRTVTRGKRFYIEGIKALNGC